MMSLIRRSLPAKLLVSACIIGGIILAFMVFNTTRVVREQVNLQARIQATNLEHAYHAALIAPLISLDYATMKDMLDDWRQAENISYMVVTDAQNRPIISSGWDIERHPLPIPGIAGGIRHVMGPIVQDDQVYGYLYFGLSTRLIDQLHSNLLTQGILVSLIGILAMMVCLGGLIFYMTRHLAQLAHASERVAQGHFEERVAVRGEDELAVLSKSFNIMIDNVEDHIRSLKENEENFRAIADYTYAWESWLSNSGKLRWVNPAVQRITGYSPEECYEMQDFPLPIVHPNDQPLVEKQLEAGRIGQSGHDQEFRVRTKAGNDVWVAVSWQPIYDANGNSMGWRSSVRDITIQKKAVDEVNYQAEHDLLTNLYNRVAFDMQVKQALEGKHLDWRSIAVFYLDLDQFKVVNDICGHAEGDKLLIDVARLITLNMPHGFIARLGGDEYGILMRGLRRDEAQEEAKKLITEIQNYEFRSGGRSFKISASVGIVIADEELDSATQIMIAADTACYAAKERGRNQAVLYDENEEYFRIRKDEFSSVAQINTALTQGRFILYFQRVEPLAAGLPTHAEILIRIRDVNGNIQSPVRFISAAERYNLMPYIDRWVIEGVCRQLSEWQRKGVRLDIHRFAVNVSGASLSEHGFPDFIENLIKRYKIDPERLCFEITESCAVNQLSQAMLFIQRVHDLGASLALDDFGSGLSSFGYLKRFKVDYLKIDGQFVRNLDKDRADRAVVESMVQLARAFGLKTIAEFVENVRIYEILKDLGVDYSQGYVCHVPEPLINLVEKS
ncbi:MAG: EAL domain-containing protein [Zoogloeaceae bacterium]|jgi:diguanylate cyclase (GGDEF)-like protein/PAS domain S-box-containing protein|nr:EAL domain-containing protein [Zoogloeaceae bacterium]